MLRPPGRRLGAQAPKFCLSPAKDGEPVGNPAIATPVRQLKCQCRLPIQQSCRPFPMPFTRIYEEHEVSADLKRLYADIRSSFDLAFVPTIFKALAHSPDYLKLMWDDLGPVARSREFLAAATALDEYVRSLTVRGGWVFHDQQRILASQRFSESDVATLGTVVATFARALPRLVLFSRLMQRGYSGGQTGRSSSSKQAAALSRIVQLNVPNESDAGLRVWLIYSDFKRTTGAQNV